MRSISSGRSFPALIRTLSFLLAAWIGLSCSSFRAARLYQSGTSELRSGEYGRAVEDLERASTLAPHASEIQNHLGLALLGAGRERDAEAAFRRALDLDCDNLAAAENLKTVAANSASVAGVSEPSERSERAVRTPREPSQLEK